MLESLNNKVNYMIMNNDNNSELIIRAENSNKEKGLKIVCDSNNEMVNKILKDIKDYNFEQVIEYLRKNEIEYSMVNYL